MDNLSELFDVVDENDQVIGQATRKEVHAQSLLHRSVHILVFNSQGELYLQKRSIEKDENPGYWDTSAAGHVNAGEDYLECAHRELKEELDIEGHLKPFVQIQAGPETFWEHVRSYTCISDQTIHPNPEEITEGRFWPLEAVSNALGQEDLLFTSTFRILFDKLKERPPVHT